ncbi:MAG: helix-turn-helix domain-containing protein [Lachnospiraceae bacterium]|nr:helix-turn-helix domain-containing protein [Lachnospiraceae bacterium]
MKMKILKREKRICACCMEEHEVKTVRIREQTIFKDCKVNYDAIYTYCDVADELYMDECQIQENDIRVKDAYREKNGLLTSMDIFNIRGKYGITQRDLCALLGWGGKTITRYESHQVQDRAHDMILKKIDSDPVWFLSLLEEAKGMVSEDSYRKYYDTANLLCNQKDSNGEENVIRAMIDARLSRNMSQKELSEKTGIAQAEISRLENGTRNPSIKLLQRLADGMGMVLHVTFTPKGA